MFEIGELVTYKDFKGKVIFTDKISLSILVGAELPRQTQLRLVVYHYDWQLINRACDSN